MSLLQLKIGTRLGAGFAVLLALIVIVAALGITRMAEIQEKLNHITKINNVEIKLIADMRGSVYQRAVAVRNVLLQTKAEAQPEIERIQKQRERFQDAEEKLKKLFLLTETSEVEKNLLAKIHALSAATGPLVDKVLELGLANKDEEATQVLLKEVRPRQREWLDVLKELADVKDKMSEEETTQAEVDYTKARNWVVVLSTVAVILGTLIAFFITRSITQPINQAVVVAKRVADGDLTSRIEVKSSDEIGMLMQALKEMNDNLSNLIKDARKNAEEVFSASSELAASASQVAAGSQAQSEAASSMAAAVEEMTVSVTQIADHANEAHTIAKESSALATTGGNVIHGTISEMKGIAESVNESSRIVQELAKQSEQISGIVKIIKEVAEQTNLLALNAAIEAARAGEQGRGFAVVADEVRKLAERTSLSTIEISDVIGKIQGSINDATESLHSGVEMANQGMEKARQAGDSVSQINTGSQRVVGTVNDISSALKEQSVATNEIAKSVEKVAQMAEENSFAVEETAKTAHHLEQLSTMLQVTVGRFKI